LLVAAGTGAGGAALWLRLAAGAGGAIGFVGVAFVCAGEEICRAAAGSVGGYRGADGPRGGAGDEAGWGFLRIWGAGTFAPLLNVGVFTSTPGALSFDLSVREALKARRSARVGRSFFAACAALSTED
jgi:hypothetical protein